VSKDNNVIRDFRDDSKVVLLHESVELNQIPEKSLDLAASLGVLHHIADTQGAIQKVAEKIKPGGTFLGTYTMHSTISHSCTELSGD